MAYDPTEELAQTRDELDRVSQQFENAAADARGPVTEYDRTGTVTVDLDEDGRLDRVKIASAWSRHYRPEELGGAVQEALLAGAAARAHRWGEKFAESREPVLRPAATFDTVGLSARLDAAQERGVDTEAVLIQLRDMLREINAAVGDVSDEVAAFAAKEFHGRSSSRHVTATVSGTGDLMTLEFEQPWAETAHPTNLGREATEAIQAAQQARAERSVDNIIADSALGEAGRLAADPEALMRRVGLV